jgi:c-di-GMP-binding flagellar brake protein YcgR
MIRLSGNEKRLHPRINQSLPINLAVNGYDFSTTTHNISCLGASCTIDKYVPPFTKVMIRMDIPANASQKNIGINCKGVVVRTQDADNGFNIAIFFNAIPEIQRKKISKYVERFLPQATPIQ